MRRLLFLLGIALAAAAPSAAAFWNAPIIIPIHPVSGEPVSLSIYGGQCDAFFDTFEITRTGNLVRIVADGSHYEAFCFYGNEESVFSLGTFLPGTYTVELFHRYEPQTFPAQPVTTVPVATIAFTVSESAPAPVPAIGPIGIGFAILLIALAGVLLRHRHGVRLTLPPIGATARHRVMRAPTDS